MANSGANNITFTDDYYNSKYGRIPLLTTSNYNRFATDCKFALAACGAWGIVKGDEARPAGDNAASRSWVEKAQKAIQIITNSVSPSLKYNLQRGLDDFDPASMWEDLATLNRSNSTRHVANLVDQFQRLEWNPKDEDIQAYYTRLADLRDQLNGTIKELSESDLLWKIVNSIPREGDWKQARQLCIDQDRDLASTIETIQSYEADITKEVKRSASANIATTSTGFRPERRGNRNRSFNRKGQDSGRNRFKRTNDKERVDRDTCLLCKKKGHRVRDCFKLAKAQKAIEESEKVESAQLVSHFTNSNSDCYLYPTEHALVTRPCKSWAIDSGATRHFSGYIRDFASLKRWRTPRTVKTATGATFEAIGSGSVTLKTTRKDIHLNDVWFIPEFNCRLVSTSILNDGGVHVVLENRRARAYQGSELMFEGNNSDGLYYIDLQSTPESSLVSQVSDPDLTTNTSDSTLPTSQSERELWHRRLGHPNYRIVDRMPQLALGITFCRPKEFIAGETACECCLAGRMKESFNKRSDNRVTTRVRRVHCDISGLKSTSLRGYHYFLLVIDDATRYGWIRYLKTKDAKDCVLTFKELIMEIETFTQQKVALVRSDNGRSEFGSEFQAYLKEKGIIFEPSPPYKHSLNGVVERAMAEVNKIARCLIYEAKTPELFWCYATEHALYLKNRLSTTALPWGEYKEARTPFEAFYGKQPDISSLRPWGCVAYPFYPPEKHPKKLDPRIRGQHMFLGLRGNRIWKFLNLDTLREEVSADIQFHELKYPVLKIDANGKLQARNAVMPHMAEEPSQSVGVDLRRSDQGTKPRPLERMQPRSAPTAPFRPNKTMDIDPIESTIWVESEETAPRGPVLVASQEVAPQAREPTPMFTLSKDNPANQGDSSATPREKGTVERQEASSSRGARGLSDAVFKPTRSGRVPKRTVFSDTVAKMVTAFNVVHIDEETGSLGAPSPLLEVVTLEEALREDAPKWQEAILAELRSLESTKTFSVVPIPKDRKVIRSRWVLRNKLDAQGALARRKARLVIKGFEQQYGLDYFSTFASVARFDTLRVLLAKAAVEDPEIEHMDVDTAFLNPTLEEEVYMEVPEFFHLIYPNCPPGSCLKLLKSLYGLKQAPRAWLEEVVDFFSSIGFESSTADPNLFVQDNVYILVYVDDFLFIGPWSKVAKAKSVISSRWKCKDLGAAGTFVGFQIMRDRAARRLTIHQSSYLAKLLKRFGLDKANPTKLPLPSGSTLTGPSEINDLLDGEYQPTESLEITVYRQIIGSLIYLANGTRPDICFAISQLARHMQDPRILHLRLAKQVLRYLNGTRKLGITYRVTNDLDLYSLYSDATWGSESDRTSITGWAVKRAGGAVSWVSQRQKSTALSTMEAEFVAASEASRHAAWLEKLRADLKEPSEQAPTLWSDNRATIDLIHDPKHHAKAKHIDIRYLFIRKDMVVQNRLKVDHIPGEDQPADILTKQLPVATMSRHMKSLGLVEFEELKE